MKYYSRKQLIDIATPFRCGNSINSEDESVLDNMDIEHEKDK